MVCKAHLGRVGGIINIKYPDYESRLSHVVAVYTRMERHTIHQLLGNINVKYLVASRKLYSYMIWQHYRKCQEYGI